LGGAGGGRGGHSRSRPHPEGLNDSKLMTPEAREDRYHAIIATSIVSVVIGR
jgi:ribonuclease HII